MPVSFASAFAGSFVSHSFAKCFACTGFTSNAQFNSDFSATVFSDSRSNSAFRAPRRASMRPVPLYSTSSSRFICSRASRMRLSVAAAIPASRMPCSPLMRFRSSAAS